MIVLGAKQNLFLEKWDSLKGKLENADAIFELEDSSEVKEFHGENLLLFIDGPKIELDLLTKVPEAIIIHANVDLEWINNIVIGNRNITACIPFDFLNEEILLNKVIQWGVQKNENRSFKEQVDSLTKRLTAVLETFEDELINIKKVYKKMVPFRKTSYKGVTLTSKFYTGESSGGDYFDVIENENNLIIGASSCNSYLLSTCFITHFSKLKSTENVEEKDIFQFFDLLKQEFDELSKSSNKELQLYQFLISIDLKTLEFDIYNLGEYLVFNDGDLVVGPSPAFSEPENVKYKGRLERGGKYFILSPGVVNNWKFYNKELINETLKKAASKETADIIDEISLNLKKHEQDSFLKFDSSIIAIEVDQNVIHSV